MPEQMSNREKAGEIADAIGKDLDRMRESQSFGVPEATAYAHLLATLGVADVLVDVVGALNDVRAEISRVAHSTRRM